VYVKEDFIRFEAGSKTYKKFESFLSEQDYKKTTSNLCNFIINFSNNHFIILFMYVDDILIVDKNISRIDKLNKTFGESFSIKDLRAYKKILGISISYYRIERRFGYHKSTTSRRCCRYSKWKNLNLWALLLLLILNSTLNKVIQMKLRRHIWA